MKVLSGLHFLFNSAQMLQENGSKVFSSGNFRSVYLLSVLFNYSTVTNIFLFFMCFLCA